MELRRNEKITFRCTELEKDALAEQFEHDNLQMSWNIKSRLRELTGLEENAIIFNNSNKMLPQSILTTLTLGIDQ